MISNDYLLERKLQKENPDLFTRAHDTIVVLQGALESYHSRFPDFTDHSTLHSMDVLDFSNHLLAEQVDALSPEECYVLIMSCYLHDAGMGIHQEDFKAFSKELGLDQPGKELTEAEEADIIRRYHNEFSGLYIRKYAALFDIPDNLIFPIVQVSRGHRKTDLFDEKEYPTIKLENGVIRTAALSAVIRLADEIDIAVDRNPEILFDTSRYTQQCDIDAFGTHESIRNVDIRPDNIVLVVKPKEPRFVDLIEDLAGKVQETLDYCREVADKMSDLSIFQKRILVEDWKEASDTDN